MENITNGLGPNEKADWLRAINNPDLEGLFRNKEGILCFDFRYRLDSPTAKFIGARSLDLNIIGSYWEAIPPEICAELGIA